ncbi:MAG: adenylate/guanylate cyclase domain-containing protein [Deltaproteobacteria bacterium]|nr:adenylate/guanylate cyclase domain-containing protein [Deltaproteobacteria bacterium]
MMHMEGDNYQKLVDLALECNSIRYFGILDKGRQPISQSDLPASLSHLKSARFSALEDGAVLERTKDLILVSFKTQDLIANDSPNNQHTTMMGGNQAKRTQAAWFLVGIDITLFKKHSRDMTIQIVAAAIVLMLLSLLAIVFLGIIQRYELAHLSIEKLKKIKRLMSYFVPDFAKTMIEKNPEQQGLLDKYIEDATILFLDVEGFTLLLNTYSQAEINRVIEAYFSEFLDLIKKNNGDINETAGDGMMVIFKAVDPDQHPQNAIRAALQIRELCREVSRNGNSNRFPIQMNIGIQSGEVYLGSTKMRGLEGERWTYTASGAITITAARLSQYAQKGQILIGKNTAQRVGQIFKLHSLGGVQLKNLKREVEIFEIP